MNKRRKGLGREPCSLWDRDSQRDAYMLALEMQKIRWRGILVFLWLWLAGIGAVLIAALIWG